MSTLWYYIIAGEVKGLSIFVKYIFAYILMTVGLWHLWPGFKSNPKQHAVENYEKSVLPIFGK